jgi:UDP-N-acetylglucosamine 2-epimerase (non-hydrolysing)
MIGARVVVTDSGGIQEETTVLGVPCVTVRENTERPITLTHGTNHLAGVRPDGIRAALRQALDGAPVATDPPPLWDGRAAGRIVDVLRAWRDR